jgi:hypothetical protein
MKVTALLMTAFLLIAALTGCDKTYTLTTGSGPTPTPTPPPCSGTGFFGNDNTVFNGLNPNYAFGSAFTNVDSASVTALAVYSNAYGNAILGIYSDNAGLPNKLLGQTASQYCSLGWNYLPLTLHLYPGTYWLIAITDTANIGQNSSGGYAAYKAQTFGPLPNSLSGASTVVNTLIIAALYSCP